MSVTEPETESRDEAFPVRERLNTTVCVLPTRCVSLLGKPDIIDEPIRDVTYPTVLSTLGGHRCVNYQPGYLPYKLLKVRYVDTSIIRQTKSQSYPFLFTLSFQISRMLHTLAVFAILDDAALKHWA